MNLHFPLGSQEAIVWPWIPSISEPLDSQSHIQSKKTCLQYFIIELHLYFCSLFLFSLVIRFFTKISGFSSALKEAGTARNFSVFKYSDTLLSLEHSSQLTIPKYAGFLSTLGDTPKHSIKLVSLHSLLQSAFMYLFCHHKNTASFGEESNFFGEEINSQMKLDLEVLPIVGKIVESQVDLERF